MDKILRFILKYRWVVIALTAVALVFSVIGISKININSDISSYLPADSTSKKALDFLHTEFDVNGDATLCVESELSDYEEIKSLVKKISDIDDVASITWLGQYESILKISDGDFSPAISVIPAENVKKLADDYYKVAEGKGYYILYISLEVPNSGGIASEVMVEIEKIAEEFSKEREAEFYLGGNAMDSKQMLDSALGDLPKFLALATAVIAIILLLTSKSVMASLIFLLTIGISIIFNMGTNFFASSISTITFSVASILQLALSMDYSIFLTHAYDKALIENDERDAMVAALKKTGVVILASALTTIAGFCALFVMKFELGFDLGLCLAKGVLLSFLTVLIIQPCLMTVLKKACDKTTHRTIEPKFKSLASLPKKWSVLALILVVILSVPSIFFATQLDYYYIESNYNETPQGAEKVIQDIGNRTVYVVEKVSDEKQLELLQKLRSHELTVLSYYSLLDTVADGISIPFELNGQAQSVTLSSADVIEFLRSGNIGEKYNELLSNPQIKAQYDAFADSLAKFRTQINLVSGNFFKNVDGREYTYFMIMVKGATESKEAISMTEKVDADIAEILGDSEFYAVGNTQIIRDMAKITNRDFLIVSALSALLILIILIITFKSFMLPGLLVVLIELAILMNLSVSAVLGSSINFMSYIIISAIQMGATIDYAILLVKNYRSALAEGKGVYRAIECAIKDSAFSIIISMAILFSACISVFSLSSDRIVSEIALLIARGSVISAAIVLFVLPALCCLRGIRKAGRRK